MDSEMESDELTTSGEEEQVTPRGPAQRKPPEHFVIADGSPEECDINSMYDFSQFLPHQAQGPLPSHWSSSSNAPRRLPFTAFKAAAHTELVEAREDELETKLESQERKLHTASKALQRAKSQVQQLTAQVGLKELHGTRMESKVIQLRALLIDKERRLQEALDEAEAVRQKPLASEPVDFQPSPLEAQLSELGEQPQEPPCASPAKLRPALPSPAKSEGRLDEGQLIQLAEITEELTDALEFARESEEESRRQLEAVAAQLREEQSRHELASELLTAERARHAAEVAALMKEMQRGRPSENTAQLAAPQLVRSEMESMLQKALSQKGKGPFFPHIMV